MPRIIKARSCPHCGEALPTEVPRVCPSCAGSLQKRYLKLGCLSTAPIWILAVIGLRYVFGA
jgi:hypothetical protein